MSDIDLQLLYKSKSERFENIKKSFSISHPPTLHTREGEVQTNQTQNLYIIIDDVTTSGATILEARKTLAPFLHIPESEIYALTVAY